jgi:tetratricopeptide (TPR) repeat protein
MPMPDAIFEHRMYLPLAAVMVLVVLLAYTFGLKLSEHSQTRRRLLRTVGLLLMIGITVLFVVLTRARNDDYASEETMWRDMISKNPNNYRTYNGLSSALVNRRAFAESMQVCSNLIARLPDFATMTMAEINQMAGKDPSIRSKKYYYCLAHSNLGAALFHLRRMEEAQVHNIEALRVIPGHTVARSNMAFILYRQNKVDEAIRQWYEALKWDPNELNTHFLLGIVFSDIHKFKPAIYHFRQALRFRPDDSLIQYRLAWLLAGSDDAELRNGAESLAMAKRINQAMEGKSVRALDIMGMAYAETGDFSNAIHSVERALSLASNAPPDLAVSSNSPPMNLSEDAHVVVLTPTEAMTKRLQLYREGKPFRYSKNNSEGFPFW